MYGDAGNTTLRVQFDPTSYSVTEGETATVSVTLNITSTDPITVTYATADDTATAGADYTAATGSLVFAPGDMIKSFTVATMDDPDDEPADEGQSGRLMRPQVRLKVEDAADPTKSVETEATTTVANDWETLTFDLANRPRCGRIGLHVYKVGLSSSTKSVLMAGGKTYYFDDVAFGGGTTPPPSAWETITFDSNAVTYTLTGFGGADDSTVVVDPTNAANNVAKVVKSGSAELWAGTTVSTGANQSVPTLSFTASDTTMTVRVWSPDAGIQVRLKVEDAADNTKSVETEATTTVANDWETLTFDFANQATGTAALNLAYTYNKVSIFFNFGVTGATAGEKTYYFDDVAFGSGTTPPPSFSVGFSPKSYSVYEGEMATVTVALNMTSTNTVTVTYATADGTATAGADYTATTGSLVFAPGDLAKSFTVATTDDADEESAETVNLTLSAPISVALGSASTAVLTIKDNDQVPPTVLAVVDDFENGLPTGLDGNGLGIGFVTWRLWARQQRFGHHPDRAGRAGPRRGDGQPSDAVGPEFGVRQLGRLLPRLRECGRGHLDTPGLEHLRRRITFWLYGQQHRGHDLPVRDQGQSQSRLHHGRCPTLEHAHRG